jgi:succinate dehydrogenase cytochrome b subunit
MRPLQSTIGRKIVMAVSGIVLFLFVLAHMAGNLQVFLGAEVLDAYGLFLRSVGHGLGIWVARSVLLLALVLHVWAAYSLLATNRRARPQGYRQLDYASANYASRTMQVSGPLIALFAAYHVAHLTLGLTDSKFEEGHPYHNVVAGFQAWPVSTIYIAAMIVLGFHLFHGFGSMLQTLGLGQPRFDRLRRRTSALLASIIVIGNVSIPLAVLAGWVR